jgi:hypothetical protein
MRPFAYKMTIPVLLAREDGATVAYTPALNLGSCGRTQHEAMKRLGNAISLFFSELVEMGTLDKALQELGWKKVSAGKFSVPRVGDQPRAVQRSVPTCLLARRSMNVMVPLAA